MNPIAELAVTIIMNTLYIMNTLLLSQLLFGVGLCRKWQHYLLMGSIFATWNLCCVLIFPDMDYIQVLSIYLYILLIVILLSKGHRIRSALFTLPAIMLSMQWAFLLRLVDHLFLLDRYTITVNGVLQTPLYFFSDFLLFPLLVLLIYHTGKTGKRLTLSAGESIFLFFFCVFVSQIAMPVSQLGEGLKSRLYSICWIVLMLIFNIVVFYCILYRCNSHHYKTVSENYKQHFNTEYNYFKDYKKQQEEIVRFHHDWNNHMLLLQSMFEKGDYEKAADYFSGLRKKYDYSGKRILSGHEIVDIILGAKLEQLNAEQIALTCKGGLEQLQFMEDVDICILFSNLIDNAIEANLKCDSDRYLSIQTSHNPSMLMVSVSNRMNGSLRTENNRIISSKGDRESHGIGTQNVFSIIKKYHGTYHISTLENSFTIQMVFPSESVS